jgi:anaerobic dimethyl sulfoxide reductase subunit A
MRDCRVSLTAAGPATININPVPGTDPFLFQSAMYHLITKTWDANGNKIGSYLDEEFILKYVHGFFDDAAYANHPSIQKGYHSDVNRDGTYIVPDGASLSAYVMGTDDRLVKAGLNGAVSVYPDDIGYNNYDTEDATNTQKNALVPVYGQTPKTPEWASEICGVPANSIKEFAELVATTKCHFWIGGGQQRNTEGEQSILNSFTLGVITKNFGVSGTHTGMFSDRKILGFFGLHFPTGSNAQNGYYFTKLYDFSKLTTPISPTTYLPKYSPAVTIGSYPILLWPDVVKNGGSGQSRWNDGQVKRMPATIKAILNFSGNSLTNQCGDYNYVSEVVKEKSDIELIVCSDLYMTASTRFADYILPAAGAFEKDSACSSYYAGDAIIRMHKAVEPMGECKSDFEMCELLADKFGIKSDYNDGMTEKEMVRHIVEPILSANNANMTYEEWEEKGVFRFDESYGITDPFANYRANPASSPLSTPSGKFEVYNQAMVEDYEARGYDNFDTRVTLNGSLHDGSNSGRYVYPIPMCIPILEGKFANDSHPDPMGLDDEYPFGLMSWHSYYRSHSTHFNNAYVNEVYKKDKNGNPAFSNPDRSFSDGVCDTDVYEPVWINPSDAATQGIQNGNRVVVESPRGKIYCSAQITQRIRPGWLGIAEGGNANGDNKSNKPDIGGAINVLTKLNPSRICQGESFSGDNRVKIYQA